MAINEGKVSVMIMGPPDIKQGAKGPYCFFSAIHQGREAGRQHKLDFGCFGDVANSIAELSRGDEVVLHYHLQENTYTDREGTPRRRDQKIVDKFERISKEGGEQAAFQ